MTATMVYRGVDFLNDAQNVKLALLGIALLFAVMGFIAPEAALAGNATSGCHCGGGC